MISQELSELLKPKRLIYRIMWTVMTGSAACIIVVGFMVFGESGEEFEPLSTLLQAVNLVLALSFAFMPFLLRGLFLTDARIRSWLEEEVSLDTLARNQETGELDSEYLAKIEALEPFEQRLLSRSGRYLPFYMLSLISNEMVAAVGLIWTVLAHTTTPVLILGIVGVGLNLSLFSGLDAMINRALAMRNLINVG